MLYHAMQSRGSGCAEPTGAGQCDEGVECAVTSLCSLLRQAQHLPSKGEEVDVISA